MCSCSNGALFLGRQLKWRPGWAQCKLWPVIVLFLLDGGHKFRLRDDDKRWKCNGTRQLPNIIYWWLFDESIYHSNLWNVSTFLFWQVSNHPVGLAFVWQTSEVNFLLINPFSSVFYIQNTVAAGWVHVQLYRLSLWLWSLALFYFVLLFTLKETLSWPSWACALNLFYMSSFQWL